MRKLSIFISILIISGLLPLMSQDFMKDDSELWYQKGKSFYDAKEFDKAKEALNLSLDMWSGNSAAKKLLDMMDGAQVIDEKKGKETAGWAVRSNSSVIPAPPERIIAVNDQVVVNDDAFHWLRKGDSYYSSGDLKGAVEAYQIAYEMAPGNAAIKDKLDKLNIQMQNEHFDNLYPSRQVVRMDTLVPRHETPAAVKVVTSGGSLLSADPIYKEVVTEVGVPQIPVGDIDLVKHEDNVFPNVRLQELVVRVKKGMTFEEIFKKYLKNYQDMKQVSIYNKIKDMNKISPDMLIRIPVKYLNLDYVDQYFAAGPTTEIHKNIEVVQPRSVGTPTPVQVSKQTVAVYTPNQTEQELSKLKKQIEQSNNKQIDNLKNEVSSLKKLLVKAVEEKKETPPAPQKNPVEVKKVHQEVQEKKEIANVLSKIKEEKEQQSEIDVKETVKVLAEKISEKERQEKLQDIREKLKSLKERYYSVKKPTEDEYKHQQEVKGLKEQIYQMTLELAKYRKETEELKQKPVVEKVVMDSIVTKFKAELENTQKELESRKRIILKLNEELIQQNKQAAVYNRTQIEKNESVRENQKLKEELEEIRNQLTAEKQKMLNSASTSSSNAGPKPVLTSASSAESHFQVAMEYWKKGLFAEAVDEYKKAVELDPSFMLRDDQGLTEAALNYARSTIKERNSSMNKLHYKLAVIYQKKGMLNKALDEYKEILAESPNEEEVFFNMGLIFEQMKNYKSALESFEKISSLPKVSEKYVRMATSKIENIADKLKK